MRYSNKPYLAILLVFALFVCWQIGVAFADEKTPDFPTTDEELRGTFPYLAITDMDRETEMAEAVDLNLSKLSDGYEITQAGAYHLTGELRGSLKINAPEENVHLFLDGVSITAMTGPALYCEDGNKLIITLMPDSENTLSDSGKYPADGEVESCLYSRCDLTINGTGALSVNGYYKDAIRSRDTVKILGGDYSIKCKRTAIHGTDGIVVTDGSFMISSEKFGLKSTKSNTEGRGNIVISGGELSIIAGRYAFVTSKADLYIYDCTIYERSVMSEYDLGGTAHVQEGCIQ